MNTRERFLFVMNFEPIAPPKWEFGYWAGALRRWYGEGLVEQTGIPSHLADGQNVCGGGGAWTLGRYVDLDVRRALGLDEGTPRALLGQVQVLTAYYDCPNLMHDIINDLADYMIALYDRMLDQVDVDLALIWEDMAYKNGPLISPALFREFMLPAYKKLTGAND